MKIKKFLITLSTLSALISGTAFSQEALKSTEEDYYDYLSLCGLVERPTLNYRTLSDNEWNLSAETEHLWKNNNLGTKFVFYTGEQNNFFTKGLNTSVKLRIYGPEWFNSYNTASPYGQNDGALWQGKGYNTSLTGGVRLETYGFELTLKPQISFSQNAEFDFINPAYSGTTYEGKADTYGYYGVKNVDAPQRFGDSPFFTYDWGDSEVRWSWYGFTLGFGTQSPWLGPAKINPIIHSNNAATYPKIDIGLRKTELYMPHFGWYLGDLEMRGWWGKLTESDYFDNDETNDNNLITGLSFAYAFPGFLKGLSLGLNRTMLSKWSNISPYTTLEIFIPGMSNLASGGTDESDQRFSIDCDYVIPQVGLEIYFEWARNDYSPTLEYIIRYPFHTQAWTAGIQKSFKLNEKNTLQFLLECTDLETSADYDRLISWSTSFYVHHIIMQGYTNRGQWLGAGIGTGGNSQYFGVNWINPYGNINFFVRRNNPDLDYTMYIDSKSDGVAAEANIRCKLDFGIEGNYYFMKNWLFNSSVVFEDERNPLNKSSSGYSSDHRYNLYFSLGCKYTF